jgi:PAS domain S-box-containing protein
MDKREEIEKLEAKIFHWRIEGLDNNKKELWKLSSQEVKLLIEDLTLKNIQCVEMEHLIKEIDEVQDKYRELYNSCPYGYLALNETCEIQEANLAITQILGLERLKLLKMNLENFIPPDSQEVFRAYFSILLQTGTKQTQELLLKRNSGIIFKAGLSGIVTIDSKKNACWCHLFITEIDDSTKSKTPTEKEKSEVDAEIKDCVRQRLYTVLSNNRLD